jgi:hypothetical protein
VECHDFIFLSYLMSRFRTSDKVEAPLNSAQGKQPHCNISHFLEKTIIVTSFTNCSWGILRVMQSLQAAGSINSLWKSKLPYPAPRLKYSSWGLSTPRQMQRHLTPMIRSVNFHSLCSSTITEMQPNLAINTIEAWTQHISSSNSWLMVASELRQETG